MTPQLQLQLHYTNYTTLQLQLHFTTLQLQLQLHYTTLHPAVVGDHCNHCNHSKKHNSNHLSVHQWIRSAIRDSQQPTSPIGFLLLELLPLPCAVLLVHIIYIYMYLYIRIYIYYIIYMGLYGPIWQNGSPDSNGLRLRPQQFPRPIWACVRLN